MLHLVGYLYYLYQWYTVKQISDNEVYLLIKYIKSLLWKVAKRLSYTEDARCLKVELCLTVFYLYFITLSLSFSHISTYLSIVRPLAWQNTFHTHGKAMVTLSMFYPAICMFLSWKWKDKVSKTNGCKNSWNSIWCDKCTGCNFGLLRPFLNISNMRKQKIPSLSNIHITFHFTDTNVVMSDTGCQHAHTQNLK